MKNLKPVPADKKKSLGKLPTDVRNKMGYAKKGSMMKASKGGGVDMSKTESRGTRIRKLLNAASAKGAAGEAAKRALKQLAGAQKMSEAEMEKLKSMMPKKAKGGEMKKGYGAARTSGMGLQDENLIPGKSMDYYKDLM